MIAQIPYWKVDEVWAEAVPLLQKALARQDEWTLGAVYRKLVNPLDPCPMQLWLEPGKFAGITQINAFPSGVRKLLFFLCGGSDVGAIAEAHESASQWAAKYFGCTKTIIYGRRGWLKALDGYQETNTIMEKTIWHKQSQ